MQKERLAEEFTTALNMFQSTQRKAAQKEKEQIQRVRANSGLGDPFGGLLNIKLRIMVNKMFCRMSVARIQKAWSLVY
jgi:DNA topoisomerase IB